MPKRKTDSEKPEGNVQPETRGQRISPDFFIGPQAVELRSLILREYNERTKNNVSRYEDISLNSKTRSQNFLIKDTGGTDYSDNWVAIIGRMKIGYKLDVSPKFTLRFLDLLADGRNVEQAATEVRPAYAQDKAERAEKKGHQLPLELFANEDPPSRIQLRDALLAEYNKTSSDNKADKYEAVSVSVANIQKFDVRFSGVDYQDSWAMLWYKIRKKYKLDVTNTLVLRFLDLLADGKSEEEAKKEIEKASESEKTDREHRQAKALPVEMFASFDLTARADLRSAILAEYSKGKKTVVGRFADLRTRRRSEDFTIEINGTSYSDDLGAICNRVRDHFELELETIVGIFRFLDLLADGKNEEEAKAEVMALDAKERLEREERRGKRISVENLAGGAVSERQALRTALLSDYNKRTKNNIAKYEEVGTGIDVMQTDFIVKVAESKEYRDSFQALLRRVRREYDLRLGDKYTLLLLDLLADGKSLEEAQAEAESAYGKYQEEKKKEQESRLAPEAFAADLATRLALRSALLAEYNQRNERQAASYSEMVLNNDTMRHTINVGFGNGQIYIDNYNALVSRIRSNYEIKTGYAKLVFRFLDLLADGKTVEQAKKEALGPAEAKERQEQLEAEFEQEVESTANNGELLNRFKVWVSIFGPHAAADILFAHNPRFKGVREEFVKGILADYLGDSLVQPLPFVPGNLSFIEKRFLENPNLQEGLYICLIHACSLYLSRQKATPKTAANILEHFMVEMGEKIPPDAQDLFLEIIVRVATYFRSVFDNWKRPQNMVDKIVEDRDFPDTTQIINILEIKEKQRLLIADRMGVGKSASAIATKEFLGLRQALVIVPANVIPTWEKYLSGQEKGGYFIKGQEPKVLVVSSVEDLATIKATQADYVIISQERLSEEYEEALKSLNAEMLIVDEVHKLKSTAGVRSEVLHNVASQFESKDKYVALLSGTPAPNKVSDIAGILKLLYPERFANMEVKTIARQIIYGDITDLRALLVPRMQRKTLAEVVEMPKLIEEDIKITLNSWLQQAYEAILQDDELPSQEKIRVLRQFLMNPEILELQPPSEYRADKIEGLERRIALHSSHGRNKIVVIFNDYIEGVTRSRDDKKTVVGQVTLPGGWQSRVIDGDTSMTDRKTIEKEFNEGSEPMVVYLSGKTADVGIDLSGAHVTSEYNEPWSKEMKAQQVGRSYRPGLKNDLYADTLITEGTIEEGIRRYIELKDKAIQKLLIGVDLTELEKRLLEEDDSIESDDFEVDSELATYYLNSFQDLLSMFKSIKNIGEAKFSEFLAKHGERYAGNYEALGDRSYQSNVARVSANIIKRISSGQGTVVDLASGPEMLKSKALSDLQRRIMSVDINPAHFLTKQEGSDTLERKPGLDNAVVSGMSRLALANNSVETVNLALALHYTSFLPSRGDFERLQTICEINRVLKPGGRTIITLQHGANFKDPEGFKNLINLAGFEIDSQYTGQAQGENFQAEVYTLVKKEDADFATLVELIKDERSLADGLKLKFDSHTKSFRDTRKILTKVQLGDQSLDLELNDSDKKAQAEEQAVYQLGEALKQIHNEIKAIPVPILREHKFARIKLGNRYILFKSLEQSKGVVLIK